MYLFDVTPEKRILIELLIVTITCLAAIIIDTPSQEPAKVEPKRTGAGKLATGH